MMRAFAGRSWKHPRTNEIPHGARACGSDLESAMPENVSEWLNLVFRWSHVVAGIIWIGHLYFFNWVNSHLAKTYDADSKKKVVPELMPRALFWFRWGAAWTYITGLLLLGLIYYSSDSILRGTNPGTNYLGLGPSVGILFGATVVGFLVYDILWKSVKNEMAAGVISYVLIVATAFGLAQLVGGRTMFIHIGAIFGTIMAANVWMRIWPAQKKIIAGIAGKGPAPDASVAALAGLRSKHNTYMSVPLVLFMISNHYGTIYGSEWNWVYVAVFIAVGWASTKAMYKKSGGASPAQYGAAG